MVKWASMVFAGVVVFGLFSNFYFYFFGVMKTVCSFSCMVKVASCFSDSAEEFVCSVRGGLIQLCSISSQFAISRVLFQKQDIGYKEGDHCLWL